MGIDASIAMGVKPVQIEDPMNALAKMMQIKDAQAASQFNAMKVDEYQRGLTNQNALRQLLTGFGDDHAANQTALMRGGFMKEAQDYGKAQADLGKTKADTQKTTAETQFKQVETAHKRIDAMGQVFGYVKDNPSAETALQATDYLVTQGIMTPEQAAQTKARIEADPSPNTIRALATQAYQSALSAKDQLPKLQTFNAGDRQVNQSVNPITGVPTQTGSTVIGQSADNKASQATAMRGQNMVDSRARETNSLTREANATVYDPERGVLVNKATGLARPAATFDGKPLGAKDKPLTEGQAKSALYGTRMANANKMFDTLEQSGTTTSIPGMNSGYGIGTVLNALSSADQQQLMQAKRDFLNAVLRRESGAVIGESEFANAEKQYFPQINDDKKTIAQKRANREAAMRGVLVDVPQGRRDEIVREISGGAPAAGMPDMSAIDAEIARRKGGK
jgi:hypothetical protein